MSAPLQIRDARVTLGGTPILRGLTLDVAAGTRTALVGPSGAGKTTLLRAVAGLTDLDGGTISLGGRALAGVPPHRRRVAMVFQEPRLLPHLDVAENVALPLRAAKTSRSERLARATARLQDVGMAELAQRGIGGLSGGEQQRVALARALCAEPDLLVLDEPLAAVDPRRREELRRLLVDVQQASGLTTLLVTHDREEAAELGQRVAVLLDGRIAQDDVPEALFERPADVAVARFFGTPNLIEGPARAGHLDLAAGRLAVPGAPDGDRRFVIRPEHVRLGAGPLRARVVEAVYTGTAVRVTLDAAGLRLLAITAPGDAPAAGALVAVDLPGARLWPLPDGPAA